MMVLPRVCRDWKAACVGMVLNELRLDFTVPPDPEFYCTRFRQEVVVHWPARVLTAMPFRVVRSGADAAAGAAAAAIVSRVGGARRVVFGASRPHGWTWHTSAGLANLGLDRLHCLTDLRLLDCDQMTDAGLEHVLGKLRGLTILHLRGCSQITDRGLEHVAHQTQLRSLILSRCLGFTDAGLLSVSKLDQLISLNVGGSGQITDARISKMVQLESLDVVNHDYAYMYNQNSTKMAPHQCCMLHQMILQSRTTGWSTFPSFTSSAAFIWAAAWASRMWAWCTWPSWSSLLPSPLCTATTSQMPGY